MVRPIWAMRKRSGFMRDFAWFWVRLFGRFDVDPVAFAPFGLAAGDHGFDGIDHAPFFADELADIAGIGKQGNFIAVGIHRFDDDAQCLGMGGDHPGIRDDEFLYHAGRLWEGYLPARRLTVGLIWAPTLSQ